MSWDRELYFPRIFITSIFKGAEATLQLEQLVLLSHS